MRVRLTLHNPNRARHRGGLWDLGDPGSILFRDCSLLVLMPKGDERVVWRTESEAKPSTAESGVEIYQDSSGGENWRSPNHVNLKGRVSCRFRGYEVRTSSDVTRGLRASPVLAWSDGVSAVSAAIPEFWQQFPKLLAAEPGQLRFGLFPDAWDDLHELQGGEQKTHAVWLHFGPHDADPLSSLAWVHAPSQAAADPYWIERSEAVKPFISVLNEPRLQALLTEAAAGEKSFAARREVVDEYGWRHYGEVYADHENAYYQGSKPVVSHYNNQYDLVYGMLLQWLRTGDPAWRDLADPLARHIIDVDIYHTTQDRSAYNGGLFWHTDHYLDAATATHRTFSRENLPCGGGPYGGGPGNEHNYTTGLLHYYYVTGDRQAMDAVLGLADWVVRMDDGWRNILGLVDETSTGRATATGEAKYHGPGRGAGNSINALLDGWLASSHRSYLDYAETLIRRVVHPEDDISSRELLDIERRWSYPVFFTALARYLDLKAEAGELDEMYAYAQASLVRYAVWMQEHERPYLDRREELEFPTETWAAQELRKANVLRMASGFVDDVKLRMKLFQCGAALAERAWDDLMKFESRLCTRPLAILMIEGLRDSLFRSQLPSQNPRCAPLDRLAPPVEFLGQKERFENSLRRPAGLVRMAARAVNPARWLHVRWRT
ncbi:MAG TPA: hypothetical protein VMV10_20590 [Pirellulales bacterium]|nr:hypothetical protein [Pirellulales bacterium]